MAVTPRRAFLGVGANLGDPLRALRSARTALDLIGGVHVTAESRIWRSAAVGGPGPDYLNAVLAIDTTLDATDLLAALHAVEARHGRERGVRNSPRTLDLDLLLYADTVRAAPPPVLPHPRMHQRRFVLGPLVDVAPAIIVPLRGSAVALLAALPPQDAEPTGLEWTTIEAAR